MTAGRRPKPGRSGAARFARSSTCLPCDGMSAAERPTEDIRVSTIELFFDLVFVFTITQLTSLLVAEPTWRGAAQVVLIFGNLWWMYGGYAWLTNAVPPPEPLVRLLLLAGMGGVLGAALV